MRRTRVAPAAPVADSKSSPANNRSASRTGGKRHWAITTICCCGIACMLWVQYQTPGRLLYLRRFVNTVKNQKNGVYIRSTRSQVNSAALTALRAYGFEQCPWMALPPTVRYPRSADPNGRRPGSGLGQCIERLSRWQEQGQCTALRIVCCYTYG